MAEEHPTCEVREIPGFPGYYAGADGSIWSRKIQGHNVGKLGKLRKRKQLMSCFGYPKVTLKRDRKYHNFLTHRLILLAFRGGCPTGLETRHLNGIRTDNRSENLCYGTRQENAQDRVVHGHTFRGSQNPYAKLTETDVIWIRYLFALGCWTKAALGRFFKVSACTVAEIISRKYWTNI